MATAVLSAAVLVEAQSLLLTSANGTNTLLAGQMLKPGEHISDGAGFMVMEASTGDLCVSAKLNAKGDGCEAPKLWTSGINGHAGAWALMAEYGVLEVHPATNYATSGDDDRLWQSHTMADVGCTEQDTNCSYVGLCECSKTINLLQCVC